MLTPPSNRRSWAHLVLAAFVSMAGLLSGPVPAAAGSQGAGDRQVVLITGANRGIGLAFARHYAQSGWQVIATTRSLPAPALEALASQYPAVTVELLDVTDPAAIHALAERHAGQPIDLLINNAGILGGVETQRLGELDYAVFDQVMAVNALAPIRIAEAFLPHVEASKGKKIITVTSSQGSISGARPGGGYFYSASKAAVNMMMRKLALDLKRRGIVVGLLDPGLVDTNLMAPITEAGFRLPLDAPDDVVAEMVPIIEAFNSDNTGTVYTNKGKVQPW